MTSRRFCFLFFFIFGSDSLTAPIYSTGPVVYYEADSKGNLTPRTEEFHFVTEEGSQQAQQILELHILNEHRRWWAVEFELGPHLLAFQPIIDTPDELAPLPPGEIWRMRYFFQAKKRYDSDYAVRQHAWNYAIEAEAESYVDGDLRRELNGDAKNEFLKFILRNPEILPQLSARLHPRGKIPTRIDFQNVDPGSIGALLEWSSLSERHSGELLIGLAGDRFLKDGGPSPLEPNQLMPSWMRNWFDWHYDAFKMEFKTKYSRRGVKAPMLAALKFAESIQILQQMPPHSPDSKSLNEFTFHTTYNGPFSKVSNFQVISEVFDAYFVASGFSHLPNGETPPLRAQDLTQVWHLTRHRLPFAREYEFLINVTDHQTDVGRLLTMLETLWKFRRLEPDRWSKFIMKEDMERLFSGDIGAYEWSLEIESAVQNWLKSKIQSSGQWRSETKIYCGL